MTAAELVVASYDGHRLAVRDQGGDRPAIVLLHGAAANLEAMERLAASLTPARVVSLELRGHGQSGPVDGWTWDDLTGDAAAVAAALSLGEHAVVGHSLGGMVAARYAVAAEGCVAAVNIDGHGRGRSAYLDGVAPDAVATFAAVSRRTLDAIGAEPTSGERPWVADQVTAAVARMPEREDAEAIARRNFLSLPDGRWLRQPTASFIGGGEDLGGEDLLEVYRAVPCPLMIVNLRSTAGVPQPLQAAVEAIRQGLARDLAALRSAIPTVVVETVDAPYGGLDAATTRRLGQRIMGWLTGEVTSSQVSTMAPELEARC